MRVQKGRFWGKWAPCLLACSTYTVIVQWMSTVWVGETGAQGVCLGLRNHAEIREEWERLLRVGPRAFKRVVRSHFRKTDWKCLQRIWNTRLRSGFYSQKLKYQQRCYSRKYSGSGVLGKLTLHKTVGEKTLEGRWIVRLWQFNFVVIMGGRENRKKEWFLGTL